MIYSNLHAVYLKMGKKEKAQESFSKFADISIDPDLRDNTFIKWQWLRRDSFFNENNPQVEKNCSESVKNYKELFGRSHLFTAKAFENLGKVYHKRSLFQKSEYCFFQSLFIREKLTGEDNFAILTVFNELGKLYEETAINERDLTVIFRNFKNFKVDELYRKAEWIYSKGLQISEQVFGHNSTSTGESLAKLGHICSELSKNKKAEKYFLTAFGIYSEVFGEMSVQIADICNRIGSFYKKEMTNPKKSEEFYLKSLSIYNQIGEEDGISAVSENLCDVYEENGNFVKVVELLCKAMEIQKKNLGENHIFVGWKYKRLSKVYEMMGEQEKSKEFKFFSENISRLNKML